MKTPDGFLDQITDQVNDFIQQTKAGRSEFERNLKALIQSQLNKLDVVSREEFEVQQAILEKTRTQIEQLEKQLAELEKRLD